MANDEVVKAILQGEVLDEDERDYLKPILEELDEHIRVGIDTLLRDVIDLYSVRVWDALREHRRAAAEGRRPDL